MKSNGYKILSVVCTIAVTVIVNSCLGSVFEDRRKKKEQIDNTEITERISRKIQYGDDSLSKALRNKLQALSDSFAKHPRPTEEEERWERYCDEEDFRVVNLGLSVLWANKNAGAGKAAEMGTLMTWTKANEGDGQWRLPTKEEADELLRKCGWKEITTHGDEKEDGRVFEITGPSGKRIVMSFGPYEGADHFPGGYWTGGVRAAHEGDDGEGAMLGLMPYEICWQDGVGIVVDGSDFAVEDDAERAVRYVKDKREYLENEEH